MIELPQRIIVERDVDDDVTRIFCADSGEEVDVPRPYSVKADLSPGKSTVATVQWKASVEEIRIVHRQQKLPMGGQTARKMT